MRSIRIIHKLRIAMALLTFSAVVTGVVMLWWANHTGLPESWRGEIERALASQGVFTEIGTLRYKPLRGVEATEVTFFPDANHSKPIAHLTRVLLGVDRSKLAHGEVRVEKVQLTGGELSLPVDPDDPASKVLRVDNASGTLLMPGGRRIEARNVRGSVAGVRLEFDALLLGNRQRFSQMPQESEEARKARRQMMMTALGMLEPWKFSPAEPPLLRIRLEGDMDEPRSVRADLSLKAVNFSRDDLKFSKLEAKGELRGSLLVADSIELDDQAGALKGRVEYDLNERSGRFEVKSDLDLPDLLKKLKVAGPLERVTFETRPVISAAGDFTLPANAPPELHVLGNLKVGRVAMGEYFADQLESYFSWDGKRLFLDRIEAKRKDGYLKASILSDPPLVQYRIETDLRAKVWKNLFKGMPLEGVLGDFGELQGAWSHAKVKGWLDTTSASNWNCSGYAEARNISFRGVPIHSASVKMALDHDALDFTDGKVDFDYTDYPLRKAHGGPISGKGTAGRVKWDHDSSTIIVENVDGDFWPAPLVRTFAANIADHLEEYGYHTPPRMHGEGAIGIGPGQKLTNLRIHATTEGDMDYRFAGSNLLLSELTTDVKVGPQITEVRNLSFDAYGGSLRGSLDIDPTKGGDVKGEFNWTRVSLPGVSAAYSFDRGVKGVVTGRLAFDQRGQGVGNLSGEGLIALEDSELFSVPVFGPLSPVLSAVTGKKAGFEEAQGAFCTFKIDKGVLNTDDFLTTTHSIVFTGDAKADLNDMSLDMTMRMNARGLLGLITLPLKPFYGMFQFRGTGPIRAPKWESVMFTKPPKHQEKNLLTPPPKASIVPIEDGGNAPPEKKKRGFFR